MPNTIGTFYFSASSRLIGNLIPRAATARARGVGERGSPGDSCWPSIAPISTGGQTPLAHFAVSSRHARSPWTVHGQHGRSIPPDPGRCKTEIGMFRTGSWLPGQFGLVHCLATEGKTGSGYSSIFFRGLPLGRSEAWRVPRPPVPVSHRGSTGEGRIRTRTELPVPIHRNKPSGADMRAPQCLSRCLPCPGFTSGSR